MIHRWALILVAGAALAQEPAKDTKPVSDARPDRVGELERLGEGGRDLMVVGLEAPGFDKLKATQRKYAYFLYRAAIAGHDITYFQNHRFAWDIKELLETVYENSNGMDPAILDGVTEYLKLVWAHHGQYHHRTNAKFVPRNLTYKQLQKAVKVAQKNGAKFQIRKGESADQTLARLKPHIFDAKVEPLQFGTTPGQDPIATGASGLYDPGLKLADIEALPKEVQSQINVRFAKRKNRKGQTVAEPEVFRIGGVFGDQLANVSYWLKRALQYVDTELTEVEKDGARKRRVEPNPAMKKSLEDLLAFMETGDEARFKDHSIAWLKTRSAVDYLNGFYEVYKDPRAVIGAYEANVSFRVDSEKLDKLSQSAMYFETKMPWKAEWKRPKVEAPVAISVNVLVETGDGGPISPAAYNLPNYDDIRRTHGSKNVMFQNLENAGSSAVQEKMIQAFYLPEDQDLVRKFGTLGRRWMVYLHEVIGHGSGQSDASLAGVDPAMKIGGVFSALEECRADAVALYQFMDPKLVEVGAVNAEEHASVTKAIYLRYLGGQIMAQGETAGDTVRQAHQRGRMAITNWLLQPGKDYGVKLVQQDGKTYPQVTDARKAREGVGELLVKLQTFKAMGDKEGTTGFFEQFGTRIDPAIQKDAKARLETINRAKLTAFVFPQLVPVLGPSKLAKPAEGTEPRQVLQDVRLETKETLAEQQMRFRRWSRSRELAPK